MVNTINEYLKKNDISKREFAKQLSGYISPPESFDAFYQRHYKLLAGEYKELKDFETEAYRQWLTVEQADKHEVGRAIYHMKSLNPSKKIRQAEKWLSSGIFNPTKARRLTKKLKDAVKEVEELF